jgi:ABC-2 type transport system permease protein
MNILKRELKFGFKTFICWMIGLFVLVFIGIIKYQGISTGGADVNDMLAAFPRVVLAVMGIVGVDINTLGGYTAILTYYVLICAVIYAVHLGSAAVSRESVDKTYEFAFTKPCSRSHILAIKLAAAWVYLILFCIFNILFSVMAVAYLKTAENVTMQIALFTVSVFLIGSLFIALSAFLAAASKQAEKGSLYGNLAFLYAFILGIVCDMLENAGLIKLISPFKYFSAADLISNKLDPVYTCLSILLAIVFLYGAFAKFNKKDLT